MNLEFGQDSLWAPTVKGSPLVSNVLAPTPFEPMGGLSGPGGVASALLRPDMLPTMLLKREEGGPVTPGVPYLVGEKGPEVVVPSQSGQVLPNGVGDPIAHLRPLLSAGANLAVGMGGVIKDAAGLAVGSMPEPVSGAASPDNPPVISSNVQQENLAQDRLREWYTRSSGLLGLHPNMNHNAMNVDIPHLFATGAQPGFTAKGMPAFKMPDGKEIEVTPNKFAMIRTPEAVAQAAQAAQQVQGAPPSPATPAPPVTAAAALATPQASTPIPSQPAVLPPIQAPPVMAGAVPLPTAPMPIPSEVGGNALLRSAPNVGGPAATAFEPSKIMTAAGLLAAAVDPKRFGPAGEMLAKFGTQEAARARGNAAAILAGYPNAEALEAAKTEASIRKTRAETGVDLTRVPQMQALTSRILSEVPQVNAQTALTQAHTQAQQQETKFKSILDQPVLMTHYDPYTHTTTQVPVKGGEASNALNAMTQNMNHFITSMASAGHAGAVTSEIYQKIKQLGQQIPMTVQSAEGPKIINFNIPEWLSKQGMEKTEFAERYKSSLIPFQAVAKQIEDVVKNTLPGQPLKIPPEVKQTAQGLALRFAQTPDPLHLNMATYLTAIVGAPSVVPAPARPSVSKALGATPGTPLVPPNSSSWDQAPPSRR